MIDSIDTSTTYASMLLDIKNCVFSSIPSGNEPIPNPTG